MKRFHTTIALLASCLSATATSTVPDSLESLGKTDRVWVAAERITISANHETVYMSPNNSKIKLTRPKMISLTKGDHWATLNPEILSHDIRSIELKKEKAALDVDNLQDDNIEELLKIEKGLNQLISKISELELALLTEELNQKTKNRIKLAIAELQKQQERLRAKVDTGQYLLKNKLKKREIELKLDQSIRTHQGKLHNAQLVAQHDGELRFSLPKDKIEQLMNGETIWLPGNTEFATLRDTQSIHADLILNNSTLFAYEKEKLQLRVHIGSVGRVLRAHFSHEKSGSARTGNRKTWSFAIDPSEVTYATNAIGSQSVANIFYQLDEPAHIVMKDLLAPLYPEILKQDGWRGVIKKIWPDAQVVMIGPQSIALRPRK